MAKKKTEEPADEVKQEQPKKKTAQETAKSKTASKEETSKEETKKTASKKEDAKVENTEKVEKDVKQRRPPMLVTSSGDLVTHAHWYKTNDDKLFFTAKVNMVPLKSKPMDPADLDALQEKKTTLQQLFEKYYPTKVAPRFPDSDFNFKDKPKTYNTSEGQMVVSKYNVYKNTSPDSGYNIGQYMLYAEVKGPNMEKSMKMSTPASQDVLDNYFDHTRAPEKQIMMSFGDRLGLKEHYEQFKLPEGIEVKDSQARLVKDKETNQYQLNVKGPDGVTGAHTLSYYDAKAFFDKKATKEQLVAKHFDKLNNIDWSAKQDQKHDQKQETQKSMGMK